MTPSSLSVPVPANAPVGLTVILQEAAVGPVGSTLSNPVAVTFE